MYSKTSMDLSRNESFRARKSLDFSDHHNLFANDKIGAPDRPSLLSLSDSFGNLSFSRKSEDKDEFFVHLEQLREKIQRLGTVQETANDRVKRLQAATDQYTRLLSEYPLHEKSVDHDDNILETSAISDHSTLLGDLLEDENIRRRYHAIQLKIVELEKNLSRTPKSFVDKMTSAYFQDRPSVLESYSHVSELEKRRTLSNHGSQPSQVRESISRNASDIPLEIPKKFADKTTSTSFYDASQHAPRPESVVSEVENGRFVASSEEKGRPTSALSHGRDYKWQLSKELENLPNHESNIQRSTASSSMHKTTRNPDIKRRLSVPFVAGKSTGQSHSVFANWQQLLAVLKAHHPTLYEFCLNFDPCETSSTTFLDTFYREFNQLLFAWKKDLKELSKEFQSLVEARKWVKGPEGGELVKKVNEISARMETKDTAIQRIQRQLDAVAEAVSSTKRGGQRLCKATPNPADDANQLCPYSTSRSKATAASAKTNKKPDKKLNTVRLMRDTKALVNAIKEN